MHAGERRHAKTSEGVMVSAMNAYDAHQRARWMRPDAYRWLRPDATRYLVPGSDPAKIFPAFDRKFNPNQPRVPAGSPDGGQWTDGGGRAGGPDGWHWLDGDGNADLELVQYRSERLPVDLLEERGLGGHTIERHVGRSDASLLNAVNGAVDYARRNGDSTVGLTESSFSSLEAANKLVNATIARNRDKLQSVVDGELPKASLDAEFSSPTGREAYSRNERSQTVLSDTYGVKVVVVRDRTASKRYRVDTAFPTNLNRGR